jgi:hypothetical protein
MTASILLSYGDVSRKESVLPLVEILTARENWFLNNLGKTQAMDGVHISLTDTLRTAASQAVAEEADYTLLARTTPSRITNIVEKIAIPYQVSKTQQLIQHYHGQDELVRQRTKALMEWGNAAEFDIVRSTLVSGVSGTAPKMSGIAEAISRSTNTSALNSGTALTAAILENFMIDNWENSNGDTATDVFVGSFLRDVIDGFTQKSNAVVMGINVNEIDTSVAVYNSSMGRLNVHTHRYVQQSSDATGRILGIRPDKLKLAYLREPFVQTDLAKSGDYDFEAVVGDLTLEVRNRNSNFFYTGLDKD